MRFQQVEKYKQTIFKQLLYNSFSYQENSWIMSNYVVDHNAKILTPGIMHSAVDHYDEENYVLHDPETGLVGSGVSFNFNTLHTMQIEAMGFCIPKNHSSSHL